MISLGQKNIHYNNMPAFGFFFCLVFFVFFLPLHKICKKNSSVNVSEHVNPVERNGMGKINHEKITGT